MGTALPKIYGYLITGKFLSVEKLPYLNSRTLTFLFALLHFNVDSNIFSK